MSRRYLRCNQFKVETSQPCHQYGLMHHRNNSEISEPDTFCAELFCPLTWQAGPARGKGDPPSQWASPLEALSAEQNDRGQPTPGHPTPWTEAGSPSSDSCWCQRPQRRRWRFWSQHSWGVDKKEREKRGGGGEMTDGMGV